MKVDDLDKARELSLNLKFYRRMVDHIAGYISEVPVLEAGEFRMCLSRQEAIALIEKYEAKCMTDMEAMGLEE